jgi:flavin-binding protein dodecin
LRSPNIGRAEARGLWFLLAFRSPQIKRREYNPQLPPEEEAVTQKIIEVVGTSEQSFAKAAEAAVKEAAKTVRNIKWAHVDSFDMLLDGAKVVLYRATAKIYFDVEG